MGSPCCDIGDNQNVCGGVWGGYNTYSCSLRVTHVVGQRTQDLPYSWIYPSRSDKVRETLLYISNFHSFQVIKMSLGPGV